MKMLVSSDVSRLMKDRPSQPVVSTVSVLLLAVAIISVLILNAKVNWDSFFLWIFWLCGAFVICVIYALYGYLAANKLWMKIVAKDLERLMDSDHYSDLEKGCLAGHFFSKGDGDIDRGLIKKMAVYAAEPQLFMSTLSRWLIDYKPYVSFVAAVEAISKARKAITRAPCHTLDKKLEELSTHVFGADHTGTLAPQIDKLVKLANLLQEPDVKDIHVVSTQVGAGLVAAIVPPRGDVPDDFADTGASTVPSNFDDIPITTRS